MFRIGTALIVILAIGAGLLVGTLNSTAVTLDLLWIQLNWPLGLTVLVFLAVGLLFGIGFTWFSQVFPLRMKLRRAQRESDNQQAPLPEPPDD